MEKGIEAKASEVSTHEIIKDFTAKGMDMQNKPASDNVFMKIMNGQEGGAFFARLIIDSVRFASWVQLIIEYPDGDRAEVLLNHNMCTEATYDGNGIDYANVQYQTKKLNKVVGNMQVPSIYGGYNYGRYDEFKKYERPDMPIPMAAVWERIIKYYKELPIKKIRTAFSLAEAYEDLIAIGEKKDSEYRDAIGYFLDKAEMLQVCNDYGIDLGRLRRELDVKGVLDKDATTKGYQKSKKIKGIKGNYYHIRRRETYEEHRFNVIDKACEFKASPDKAPEQNVIGGIGFYNL